MQATWLLLKSGERFTENELADVGREVFRVAGSGSVRTLLELAESIGLVERQELEGECAWTLTEGGYEFRSLAHWRFWQNRLGSAFDNLFLGIDDLPENRPAIVDLFCGAGGLSLGFESAGFTACLAVDDDELACRSFKSNFPHCHVIQADVGNLTSILSKGGLAEFGIHPGRLWGIVGGPPCQSFSAIGERNPADSRSSLVHSFMDVVAELEPDFFVMENVPGVAKLGLISSSLDLLKMKSRSVGPPAVFIAASLPELTASSPREFVYDERKRKRAVAESIRSFRDEVEPSILEVGMCDAVVENAYNCLRRELQEHILVMYGTDSVRVLAALGGCMVDIAEIAIAECLVQLARSAEDADIMSMLSSLSNSNVPQEVLQATKRIKMDIEAACSANTFGDAKIGPFLQAALGAVNDKYEVSEPLLLNAAEFGDPQKRKRVFIVGINRSMGICPNRQAAAPRYARPVTAGEALDDLPDVDDCELLADDEMPSSLMGVPAGDFARAMRLVSIMPADKSVPRAGWNPFVVTGCKRTQHTAKVNERYAGLAEGAYDHIGRRARLARSKPSPTIRAGTKADKGSHTAARPIHYAHCRMTTVREGARLMGYPDWMVFHPTNWHGYWLVGNGVPRALGMYVANMVRALLCDWCDTTPGNSGTNEVPCP